MRVELSHQRSGEPVEGSKKRGPVPSAKNTPQVLAKILSYAVEIDPPLSKNGPEPNLGFESRLDLLTAKHQIGV